MMARNKALGEELKTGLDNLSSLYHELKTEINDLHNQFGILSDKGTEFRV